MKKMIKSILLIVCIVVFGFSLYKIVSYYYEGYQSEKQYSELKEQIVVDKDREMSFYEKYKQLLNENSDMVAWLTIEDTKIDYPVMLTPQDEEFYLRRNFNKEYEFRGTPFFNANANLEDPDDNMIIYAHNMDDGTMFGALRKYTKKDYYDSHKIIQLDSIYGKSEYEIFAVFKTVDNQSHELFIDYYRFFNAANKEHFDEQIQKYKRASFYETGITPEYGDELLTLSTCEYSNENGRLVVVARKVEENE